MKCHKTVALRPDVSFNGPTSYTIAYSSSDPDVVSVDSDGNVRALDYGKATITCTVTDEYGCKVSTNCLVTVKYSFLQWLFMLFFFGWIWY